jgi:hypothetical protein
VAPEVVAPAGAAASGGVAAEGGVVAQPNPGWVDPRPGLPAHRIFPTAADALAVVLADNPRILGVGELHNTAGGPAVEPAIARFRRDVFPTLAPYTTDLVLETWRLDGRCGEPEAEVAEQVETELERPAVVKDDLVLLVEDAVARGVRPHDLALSCEEYAGLLDEAGELAMDRLLGVLTRKLQEFALAAVGVPDATMVLYGGAVHNDVRPREELAAYAYGPAVSAAAGAAYTELDLYPPELVAGVMAEPAWAPLLDLTGPDRVVLFERGPHSWVLLLPVSQ